MCGSLIPSLLPCSLACGGGRERGERDEKAKEENVKGRREAIEIRD